MLKGFVSGVEKDIVRIPMKVGNEYKEGWEVRDNQERLIWGREDELQTATGTLSLKGYGVPVKVKSLLGNTVQNGTPTADNPVMPEFVGAKTGNLMDLESYLKRESVTYTKDGDTFTINMKIALVQNPWYFSEEDVHVSISGIMTIPAGSNIRIYIVKRDGTISGSIALGGNGNIQKTVNVLGAGIKFDYSTSGTFTITNLMLNAGHLAAEYEPFGYKIQISCGGETTPVYLGEVPTVRRIKKLVLTGSESFAYNSEYTRFSLPITNSLVLGARKTPAFCTNYQCIDDGRSIGSVPNNSIYSAFGSVQWYLQTSDYSTEADLKSYLAQQYANGTPVTVWYVLAEPETGIVNEPLAKIGDYVDELNDTVATLPEIPTTTGQNTLTVDTTLAPSNLTIKGHVKQSS